MAKKAYKHKKAYRALKHKMAVAGKLNDPGGNWIDASSAQFKTSESLSGALHRKVG